MPKEAPIDFDPAKQGEMIREETLGVVSQFQAGEFPFTEGRRRESFPGRVVGTPHMRNGSPGVVDGHYVLGSTGLTLNAARLETRYGSGGHTAYPSPVVLRPATPEEYLEHREELDSLNGQLRETLEGIQIKRAMQLAGNS